MAQFSSSEAGLLALYRFNGNIDNELGYAYIDQGNQSVTPVYNGGKGLVFDGTTNYNFKINQALSCPNNYFGITFWLTVTEGVPAGQEWRPLSWRSTTGVNYPMRYFSLFTGSTSLTDAQLVERVNQAVERLTQGRFAEMFKVVPAAYMSDADNARGFSWTLPIRLYANNMKTVMSLSIEAYRMSDYTAA